MESNHYDVVVVGAGLSGLTAAGLAAQQGLKVALVASGPGSFVLRAGYLKTRQMFAADAAPDMGEAITFFCEMANFAGCPFEGDPFLSRYLPTILGGFESVALAPRILWNAEPGNGSSTAIVGVRELSYFDENFMAERMREQARLLGYSAAYSARSISLDGFCQAPTTTLRIARRFDCDAAFRAELVSALRTAAVGVDRILIPSMLGLYSSDQQLAQIEREVGCALCEMPTLPPSIPGLRLFHLLSRFLHKSGVEFYEGFPVEKLNLREDESVELQIASPGHPLTVYGECVVMATGKSPSSLKSGIGTGHDEQMHPHISAGSALAANIFTAEPALQSAGFNVDAMEILSGYRAGKLAAATRGHNAAR